MASSLEELGKYFNEKSTKMKECLALRGIGSSDDAIATLRSIDIEVTEIEGILFEFKDYLSNQKDLLQKSEALKEVVEVFHQRTEYISSNLPQHLPGKKSADLTRILKDRNQESTLDQPAKKKPKQKIASSVALHKIDYLTTEEFQDVPKYLKGRLTYAQVNSAIDEIHKALGAKYKIIRTPRTRMSEHIMKKYNISIEQRSGSILDVFSRKELSKNNVNVRVVQSLDNFWNLKNKKLQKPKDAVSSLIKTSKSIQALSWTKVGSPY